MEFSVWYTLAKEFSGEDPVFILLPLLLLAFWVIAFRKQANAAMLFWGVLLVVFDLPHVISFASYWFGRSEMFNLRFYSFTLFEGLVCFLLGIVVIIDSVEALRS